MKKLLRRIFAEDAATAVEYAVMLALILMVVLGSIALLGSNTKQSWQNTNSNLESVGFGSGS